MVRWVAIIFVVLTAAARPTRADPAAERLFRDGQALIASGDTEAACDRFARSQALEERAGTALNLGNCLERLGKTASAWDAYMASHRLATIAGEKSRAAYAKGLAVALEQTLAYLKVVVPADMADGLEIERDGAPLDRAMWNVDVPIDPGEHKIVASAPGYEAWSATRKIAGADRITITIVPLVAAPVAEAPAVALLPQTTEPTSGAPAPPRDVGVVTTAPRRPDLGRWAIGAMFGESTGLDATFGVRVLRNVATGSGALRGIVSATYDHFNDDNTNGFMLSHQVLFGGAVEYVWVRPRFAFALGVTAGLDLLVRNNDRPVHAAPWWGVRVSPVIVRFPDENLELGLHIMGIQSTDRLAAFGLVGLDWYIR